MEKSIVNQLIIRVQDSFEKLNVQLPVSEAEALALFVYNGMLGRRRTFHNPQHILKVCRRLEHPLQILATLFHDIVYYQVDEGFSPLTEKELNNLIQVKGEKLIIHPDFPLQDIPLALCLEVFGYSPLEEVRPQGFNEFLSTLVAIKKLKKYLGNRNLLGIMVAIEGTIPFRGLDDSGKNCFEQMEEKLLALNQTHNLGIKEAHIHLILQLAVELANQDVENFSDANVAEFLDNTWRLIPESNGSMVTANVYTLSSYRLALEKMEGFLNFLSPEVVFQQYRQVPGDAEFSRLQEQARHNIKIAREYLQAKLTAISILEALAIASGGDAPISMFIGDLRNPGSYNEIERAEDYLPAVQISSHLEYDPMVLKLLEFGRASALDFDMQNAPLSYFVYASIGQEKNQKYLKIAREMFRGEIDAKHYLEQVDPEVCDALARACAQVAVSREEALQVFFNNFTA